MPSHRSNYRCNTVVARTDQTGTGKWKKMPMINDCIVIGADEVLVIMVIGSSDRGERNIMMTHSELKTATVRRIIFFFPLKKFNKFYSAIINIVLRKWNAQICLINHFSVYYRFSFKSTNSQRTLSTLYLCRLHAW